MTQELHKFTINAIKQKRDSSPLDGNTIHHIVQGYIKNDIPDYLMASFITTMENLGMTYKEIKHLTEAYVNSGNSINTRLDYKKNSSKKFIVDKHSTGGVGDKTTLIVAPIVAACGLNVVKISGRGLGHAGGTLDKLESIEGLKLNLSHQEKEQVLQDVGMVITGQSKDLVPGDKATYNLRDLIGYEDSVPLIAASIMSKKIVTAANGLVLDVKTGRGALINDYHKAKELAQTMSKVALDFGINCKSILSDMNNPLGYAIGNTLEISEVLDVLQGKQIPSLTDLSITIARLMLQTADSMLSNEDADNKIRDVIEKNKAYDKFMAWVEAQGGNTNLLSSKDYLQQAKYKETILAREDGWVKSIDAKTIGIVSMNLSKNIQGNNIYIDNHAGIVLTKHISDYVSKGEPIANIYYNNSSYNAQYDEQISQAFYITNIPISKPPIVQEII